MLLVQKVFSDAVVYWLYTNVRQCSSYCSTDLLIVLFYCSNVQRQLYCPCSVLENVNNVARAPWRRGKVSMKVGFSGWGGIFSGEGV